MAGQSPPHGFGVPTDGQVPDSNAMCLEDIFDDFIFSAFHAASPEFYSSSSTDAANTSESSDISVKAATRKFKGDEQNCGGEEMFGVSEDGNKRKKSRNAEKQRIERREKNREHAKRSRIRKKFLLDSLQQSIVTLENENEMLKQSIREHLKEAANEILSPCTDNEMSIIASNTREATKILDDPDYSLVKALQTAKQNFVISDPSIADNPIVFASQGFLTLTGYSIEEVLGRNCRFLQGPSTDPQAVEKIRDGIYKGEDTTVVLLNYRKDGSTFWNQVFIAALRDGKGNIVNYLGAQCQVSEQYAGFIVNAAADEKKQFDNNFVT
jgi:PAS domain S-box-containing protein